MHAGSDFQCFRGSDDSTNIVGLTVFFFFFTLLHFPMGKLNATSNKGNVFGSKLSVFRLLNSHCFKPVKTMKLSR